MRPSLFRRIVVLMLVAMFCAPMTLFAQEQKPAPAPPPPPPPAQAQDDKQPAPPTPDAKADDEKAGPNDQTAATGGKGHLTEKENPLLIGKRNINKHSINFYSLQKEVAIGQQLAAQVDQQGKFIDDPVVTEYVNRVGQNLVLHSDAKVAFTIKVLDSDDVNAFALPGGFFYVNKGLLLAADNEAEIAGVMAHEIGHVAARHGVEQASKGTLAQFLMVPLIFMTGGLAYIAYNAAQIALPLTFLKFSRGMESEADMLGAEYSWAAGYDPGALVTFFEKIEKTEKGKPGTMSKLFSSHPPTPDRVTRVKDLIARFPDRDEYTLNTSDFVKAKSRLMSLSNQRMIAAGGDRDTGPKRPTLKRRTEGSDQSQPGQPTETDPKDRPTLKRRDSDGSPKTGDAPVPGDPPVKDPSQPNL